MRRRMVWLAFMATLSIAAPWLGSVIYPWPYLGSFVSAARAQHISPYLLAAVARVESRFDPLAVSDKGAIGVMQVEPATGSYVGHFSVPDLRQPAQSVAIGARYLRLLENEFGSTEVALAAYNGGDATVRAWIQAGVWQKGRPLSDIPYPETRFFVEKVVRDWAAYSYLYPSIDVGQN